MSNSEIKRNTSFRDEDFLPLVPKAKPVEKSDQELLNGTREEIMSLVDKYHLTGWDWSSLSDRELRNIIKSKIKYEVG